MTMRSMRVGFSYIPMAVSNILSSWLHCKEHATIPFLANFGAVVVNTGVNYLLIFGKFGFSCMEIRGAAIATFISQLFNLAIIVIGFVLCTRKDGDKPILLAHGVSEFHFVCLQHMYSSGELSVCIHCLLRKNYSGLLYRQLSLKDVNE